MSDCWGTLGIEFTEDRRAIKKAYAAKLKAIDPDADPKAFLELRNALENAQWEAQYGRYEEEYDDDVIVETAGDVVTAEAPVSEEPAIDPLRIDTDDLDAGGDGANWWRNRNLRQIKADDPIEESQPAEPLDEPQEEDNFFRDPGLTDEQKEIRQIIWGGEGALSPDEEASLNGAVGRILRDPRMEQVDFQASMEDWLAWTLIDGRKRGDPALDMVSRHFGWEERLDSVNLPYHIEAAGRRSADVKAMARLNDPSHRWHAAWMKLSEPNPGKLSYGVKARLKTPISELLQSIRRYNPGIEWELHGDHVALWDEALPKAKAEGSNGGWWRWVLVAVLVMNVLRCIGDTAPNTKTYEPVKTNWRLEQAPRVQQWMLNNEDVINGLFERRKDILSPPTCDALDAHADMSAAEYDQCLEAHLARQAKRAEPGIPRLNPSEAQGQIQSPTGSASTEKKLYWTSPLWKSEQAPRVQRWMEDNPEKLDAILRPHFETKRPGLPGCYALALAALMKNDEMQQCRRAEAARAEREKPSRTSAQAERLDPPPPPLLPALKPEAIKNDPPAASRDFCADPANVNAAICTKPLLPEMPPPGPGNP